MSVPPASPVRPTLRTLGADKKHTRRIVGVEQQKKILHDSARSVPANCQHSSQFHLIANTVIRKHGWSEHTASAPEWSAEPGRRVGRCLDYCLRQTIHRKAVSKLFIFIEFVPSQQAQSEKNAHSILSVSANRCHTLHTHLIIYGWGHSVDQTCFQADDWVFVSLGRPIGINWMGSKFHTHHSIRIITLDDLHKIYTFGYQPHIVVSLVRLVRFSLLGFNCGGEWKRHSPRRIVSLLVFTLAIARSLVKSSFMRRLVASFY